MSVKFSNKDFAEYLQNLELNRLDEVVKKTGIKPTPKKAKKPPKKTETKKSDYFPAVLLFTACIVEIIGAIIIIK